MRSTRYFFLLSVLLQYPNCCNLRAIDTLIYYEEKRFLFVFLARFEALCERPFLPVRGPTSLLEAFPILDFKDHINCFSHGVIFLGNMPSVSEWL